MSLSTQQIQTVLRTYNRQLKQAGLNRARKSDLPQAAKDEVTISAEGRKAADLSSGSPQSREVGSSGSELPQGAVKKS